MDSKFVSVPVNLFKEGYKEIPFDIYQWISDQNYVVIFSKDQGINFKDLINFINNGLRFVYILESDKPLLEKYLNDVPFNILSRNDASFEDKKRAFVTCVEQTIFEALQTQEINNSTSSKVLNVLRLTLESSMEFVKLFTHLLGQSPADEIFYRHSISTCAYSFILAYFLRIDSPRSMKILLFSALFHDMGKLTLDEDKRLVCENISDEDKEKFKQHPALTVQLFDQHIPFADVEIRRCILQHKERMDGKGYPNQVKGNKIFQFSKVMAIADAFSELTLGLVDGIQHPKYQALAIMQNDIGAFDEEYFDTFTKIITKRISRIKRAAA